MSTSSGISPESSEIKQPSYLELDLIYGDGPAECAERSAAQRGRRAEPLNPGLLVLPDSSKAKFLISISGFGLPNPLPNPLPEAAHSAGPTLLAHLWRILAPLGSKKWSSKRPSKNDQIFDAISTSIFERLGSVLVGQDGSQTHQTSIKIEFPSLSVFAWFFTLIFDRFLLPTSTHWISKIFIFH